MNSAGAVVDPAGYGPSRADHGDSREPRRYLREGRGRKTWLFSLSDPGYFEDRVYPEPSIVPTLEFQDHMRIVIMLIARNQRPLDGPALESYLDQVADSDIGFLQSIERRSTVA